MVEECTALGGHGVVGVRLTIGGFPSGGLEFKAIGTAVHAPGAPPLRHPFTSDLTGQDFAKLIMKGWMPAGLVLGISIAARHDDWQTRGADPVGRREHRGHRLHRSWSTTPGTTPGRQLPQGRQAARRGRAS